MAACEAAGRDPATMRSMRGPRVPTSSGSGDCTGLGSQGASVTWKNSPLKVTESWLSIARTIVIASSNLLTRLPGGGSSMP